ncbi:MAG: hypothetical protein KKG00_05705 [Bacteroidetes bacterium]|nr:hypothetical protein [Bacteroidota bacterium]
MQKKLLLSFALLPLWLGGCQENSIHEEDVKLMARLQCEARQLKEERFDIANKMRFRGDSLMKLNISLTATQRQQEDSIKQALTLRTGEVAVRLMRTMDSLFDVHYQTVELRQQFDAAVEKKLGEVCQ